MTMMNNATSNKCSRKDKHPGLCKLSETCSKVNNHEGNCNEVVKPQTKF